MFIKHVPIRHGEIIIRKFSNGTYNVRTIYELVSGIKTYYFPKLTKYQASKKVDYYAGRHITW